MDLNFTDEQQMLKDMTREFLEAECPKALVRSMEHDDFGYPEELWSKMAELGWILFLRAH